MNTTQAFLGLRCTACGELHGPDVHGRCPDCDAPLSPSYDLDAVDLERETLAARPFSSMWRYAELLPFADPVTADEGATPLVDADSLAEELGVARLLVKDDGRNPTGTTVDRGMSVATTAVREAGADDVALAAPGNAAQSMAAYAGRAGAASHSFVPSRAPFPNKAMVNVHGGDMRVVGGRFGDALDAFADDDHDWYSLQEFTTPYRHEGAKTVAYEIAEQLDWQVPDAVIVPVGTGEFLVGAAKGFRELAELGFVDSVPPLYAAQASGCAPVAAGWTRDRDSPEPWETPDTICGELEIADPAGGALALDAIAESDGGAVAVDDPDILESAVVVSQRATVEVGANAGPAVAGAWDLAEDGVFDESDTVVVLNTEAGVKTADLLRSHLMSQGI
jgi:threonine synthase